MPFSDTILQLWENGVLIDKTAEGGSGDKDFLIQSGSRVLVVLHVLAISGTPTVAVDLKNTETASDPLISIGSTSLGAVGVSKFAVQDFTSLMRLSYSVTGGTADFKVTVVVLDGATNVMAGAAVGFATETTLSALKGRADLLSTEATLAAIKAFYSTGTPVDSQVPVSETSGVCLAANAGRKGFALFNNSTKTAYVRMGTSAASATVFWLKMAPGSYYESTLPIYRGDFQVIWDGPDASGFMAVTELT
jgi:hypothetical protein